MEYVYSAMLLHSAGKKITAENLKKVLTAAGVKADDARIKALTASLEGVNIDEAIQTGAVPVGAAAAPAAPAPSGEAPAPSKEKPEEKKEEEKKKKKEEPEVSEEEAAAGLGALFG
jgi:large subunit ribosomal protein L12